jgi:hypothetical protein
MNGLLGVERQEKTNYKKEREKKKNAGTAERWNRKITRRGKSNGARR